MPVTPETTKYKLTTKKVGSSTTGTTPLNPPDSRLEVFEKNILELREKIDNLNKELHIESLRIIEILAFFIALFTFVSVDIQVFKSDITWYAAAGFTLIMLGALTLFLIFLSKIINNEKPVSYFWTLFFASILFILSGIYFIDLDKNTIKKNYYSKDDVNKIIMASTTPFVNFKNCISEGVWSVDCAKINK